MALYLVALLFGTLVAETILASVHVRAHRQAGHMDASDLIKTLQNTLRGGGRPHMGLGQQRGEGAGVHMALLISWGDGAGHPRRNQRYRLPVGAAGVLPRPQNVANQVQCSRELHHCAVDQCQFYRVPAPETTGEGITGADEDLQWLANVTGQRHQGCTGICGRISNPVVLSRGAVGPGHGNGGIALKAADPSLGPAECVALAQVRVAEKLVAGVGRLNRHRCYS